MKIELEKCANARDLGGISTPFGTTERNRLFRSGEHSRLTENDKKKLLSFGLERVIDLRTAPEMQNAPDVRIDGVAYENVSIIRATTFGISYETLNGKEIAEKLQAGLERMKAKNELPEDHMKILYRNFVNDVYCRSKYGEFLKTLANRPVKGATLWHCSAGKDRVGTCTALLLHCLGASYSQIKEDYLLTNAQTEENTESILNKVAPFVPSDKLKLVKTMLSVSEEYLNAFFAEAEARCGGIDAFISACGVTEKDVKNLRENYLV